MQIFVSSNGQRIGPFSVFQLSEMIKDDEVSPKDLGWYQGRDEWSPLSEIPALMSVIEKKREGDFVRESSKPLDSSGKDSSNGLGPAPGAPSSTTATAAESGSTGSATTPTTTAARPMSRFWARVFDYLLVVVLVYAIFGAPPLPASITDGTASMQDFASGQFWERLRESMATPEALRLGRIQQGALVIWVLLEGYLLHRFGTTPGKALFALRVTQVNGSRMGLQQAVIRGFFVWFLGVGMWLPLLAVITLGFSLWSLLARGGTVWDRHLGSRVQQQQRLSAGRMALAFTAFLVIMLIQHAIITYR
jgi:uncharacterized RDD family membrane protein YckC